MGGRTHKGDDLSEVARDLQVALLILVTVRNDYLRACLCCIYARVVSPQRSDTVLNPTSFNEKRTELGDEIATEEACTAKDGRDVPSYRTAPCRTL